MGRGNIMPLRARDGSEEDETKRTNTVRYCRPSSNRACCERGHRAGRDVQCTDTGVTTDRQVNEMAGRPTASSIDEYIAGFPTETQKVLEQMRALIKASAPDASETISYAMPTFDLNGHHLVHFAGFARHVGFYPVPSGVEAFKEELRTYKTGKGSVQFPLDRPLPTDLIRRIVEFRVAASGGKASE
jgi:uncharacterized protein YdhG (YjbR/CyaY superfamily)